MQHLRLRVRARGGRQDERRVVVRRAVRREEVLRTSAAAETKRRDGLGFAATQLVGGGVGDDDGGVARPRRRHRARRRGAQDASARHRRVHDRRRSRVHRARLDAAVRGDHLQHDEQSQPRVLFHEHNLLQRAAHDVLELAFLRGWVGSEGRGETRVGSDGETRETRLRTLRRDRRGLTGAAGRWAVGDEREMGAFSAAAAESRRRRGDALWSPEAGLHTTSMIMRSGSSLRDCTARGPYTAASTTERSGGDGGGRGRVGGQPTRERSAERGGHGCGFASASPCSHRADPSARERNARSSLSWRIIPGVRPSARAAGIVAKARGSR